MNDVYADSLAKAKSLYKGSDDAIHDWEHSERVAANAHLLADNIGYKDKEFLELCAFWHDAARTQGINIGHEEAGAIMAQNDLLSRGASKDTAHKAYEAIRFHKSSASPVTIEGKIIRDADKLDIFSLRRWEKCAEAGWTKEYADDLRKTIATISKYPNVFTYDYTKQQYAYRVSIFLEYYESIKDQLPE